MCIGEMVDLMNSLSRKKKKIVSRKLVDRFNAHIRVYNCRLTVIRL